MMKCQDCGHLLDEYLQGKLEREEELPVEEHLKHCRSCSEEVEAYERCSAFLSTVSLPSMPEEFWKNQRMAIAKALQPKPIWQAPSMSLLVFSCILISYLYLGLDWVIITLGDYIGFSGAHAQDTAPLSFDSFDTVILLYLGIFSLAVMVFLSDSDERGRLSQRRL